MRLMQYHSDGKITFTKDLVINVPEYAILSHTWGPDTDEVSYKDLVDGAGEHKPGYKKIIFCAEQAKGDGLQYFWVDTCCIDKSNQAELSEAINSMFRWYRDAARCYVYLSDVLFSKHENKSHRPELAWKSAFRASRWFTRGWTLQELLAPRRVDFFTQDVTGIAVSALRGSSISQFDVEERFIWAEKRQTTRDEDWAYCLLGIFGVFMPLIYGEGRDNAILRLRREIHLASNGQIEPSQDFAITFSLSEVTVVDRFIAREEELIQMHKELGQGQGRRTVVVHGLGGMGKTQLAAAYAKRYYNAYSAVFWLNARDEMSLKQGYMRMAARILREYPTLSYISNAVEGGDLEEVVLAAKRWLDSPDNHRWLVIYDNYDNPNLDGSRQSRMNDGVDGGGGTGGANMTFESYDIRPFLADTYHGAVIITTRSSTVKIGHRIALGKLKRLEDGLDILALTSNRQDVHEDAGAAELAQELDGLPLALSSAGAYLDNVAITFAQYLQLYKDSWLRLQKSTPELLSYENRALYSTWNISYENVRRQNKSSALLLQLWAYLDKGDVWFELLREGCYSGPQWFRDITADVLSFNEAIRVLCNYGLIEVDKSSRERGVESCGYDMHGCTHSWTIHVLNEAKNVEMAWLAMRCVGSHIPASTEREYWVVQRRLLPHASRCLAMMVTYEVPIAEGDEWIPHDLGVLFADQGRLNEAEMMYERAIEACENASGAADDSILDTFHCLATIYRCQSRPSKSETMYGRALQGKEQTLGADHISTLLTANNLANLYVELGQLSKAEKMYERALRGHEKELGAEHTTTLSIVSNLALLYNDLGRLSEAEAMYERALVGLEKGLGAKHTSTLNIVDNLGLLYNDMGRLSDAERMYEWALQGREEALGAEHSSTLGTVHNLGNLYFGQGWLSKSEAMYERALRGYKKALGPEHISTLNTVNNLGTLYKEQGRLDEAEKMYDLALQGYKKALGAEHTSSLECVQALAVLYVNQGRLSEAETMFERALQGYNQALGAEHALTLNAVNDIGTLYKIQGRFSEAEVMYKRALQGKEKTLGTEHTSTIHTINNLGNLYNDQGRLSEAKAMYKRAI